MKRPSVSFMVAMFLLVAAGGVGAWSWKKANAAPNALRAKGSFWEALRHREHPRIPPLTRQELARQRELALESKARMIAKFPLLAVETHPVPDEENGFRLLYQLNKELAEGTLSVTPGLKAWLNKPDLPTRETAEAILAENADIIERIERIAALNTRSSANMPEDYVGYDYPSGARTVCDTLILKARLAARDGNRDEMFRMVAAALNLSNHRRDIEVSNFQTDFSALWLDLRVSKVVFEELLPDFNSPADLDRWSQLLAPADFSPRDFARLMRGEWHGLAEHWLCIFNPRDPKTPPDLDALAEVFARAYSQRIEDLTRPGVDFTSPAFSSVIVPDDLLTGLSPQGQEVAKAFAAGSTNWGCAHQRCATEAYQFQAAIGLLRLEQAGTRLEPALCATLAPDPVTGRAFILNPQTRELSAPAGGPRNVHPLVLPAVGSKGKE